MTIMWGYCFRGQKAFDITPTDTLKEFLDKAYVLSEGKGEDGDFICVLDLEIFRNSEVEILQPSIDIIC